MPIALDPTEKKPFKLAHDTEKSDSPTFYVGALTLREWRQLVALRSEIERCRDADEAANVLASGVRVALRGWSGVRDREGGEIPYHADDIDAVLSAPECYEIIQAAIDYGTLGADDKKKLESAS